MLYHRILRILLRTRRFSPQAFPPLGQKAEAEKLLLIKRASSMNIEAASSTSGLKKKLQFNNMIAAYGSAAFLENSCTLFSRCEYYKRMYAGQTVKVGPPENFPLCDRFGCLANWLCELLSSQFSAKRLTSPEHLGNTRKLFSPF